MLILIARTLGADPPMDVRDPAASIVDINQNGINEERRNTLILNLLAVAPVTGAVKYIKKIPDAEKHIDEVIEAVAKHGDDVGEVVEKSSKVWDYSKYFENELINFNDGYEIKNIIEKDIYLVQIHSDAVVGQGRSLKYWTTFEEVNKIDTIDDYMDKMALMSNWGPRDNVSIAKIPSGTKVKYAIGTAKEQIGAIETRPGGGLQLLFEEFNDSWIIETKPLT